MQNKAKWGFLKNIVNIDRFFASGAGDAEPAKKEEAKTMAQEASEDDMQAGSEAIQVKSQNTKKSKKKSAAKKKQ